MLAIALQKRKISCTIYEQASAFGEIGAGVSISRNAPRATSGEAKRGVWFDFMDGMSQEPAAGLEPLFSMIDPGVGQNAVHRRAVPRRAGQAAAEGAPRSSTRSSTTSWTTESAPGRC
ncbi:hypothetical protein OPQ81_005050 [Rhizoctonia solani]|nr:hypothetical protein OPQ81_005050 [Rhizoctonia solani]